MNENNVQTRENKANIEMLRNKINALIKILEKEGVTTKEEVDSLTKEIIEKGESKDE
jgi:hypothetical protein